MIFKKFNLKFLFLSLICLILLLGLGFGIIKKSEYNNVPYEKVEFSDTKYPKEQQKAIAFLQKEYSFENFSTKNVPYEQKIRTTIYPNDLYIALIDLNNDKIQDVIVWVTGKDFSGTRGSLCLFYIIDKQGNWDNVLEVYTHNLIMIFNKMHHGLRDIAFPNFDNIGDQKKGRNIWIWNEKIYDRIGLYPIQREDEEVFKDEIIR